MSPGGLLSFLLAVDVERGEGSSCVPQCRRQRTVALDHRRICFVVSLAVFMVCKAVRLLSSKWSSGIHFLGVFSLVHFLFEYVSMCQYYMYLSYRKCKYNFLRLFNEIKLLLRETNTLACSAEALATGRVTY